VDECGAYVVGVHAQLKIRSIRAATDLHAAKIDMHGASSRGNSGLADAAHSALVVADNRQPEVRQEELDGRTGCLRKKSRHCGIAADSGLSADVPPAHDASVHHHRYFLYSAASSSCM
jgi:hypothetical protein